MDINIIVIIVIVMIVALPVRRNADTDVMK
jgi:hypothetical protein